jgi:hypothetical protein
LGNHPVHTHIDLVRLHGDRRGRYARWVSTTRPTTRKKAFVSAKKPFAEGRADEFCGVIDGDNIGKLWAKDGLWPAVGGVDDNDLVAEWKEPKRIRGYLNDYKTARPSSMRTGRRPMRAWSQMTRDLPASR